MIAHERSNESSWQSARTFDELCALGARFVAGELDVFPGWGSSTLDLESDAIATVLARLNRAGFLTLASQPGVAAAIDHDGQIRRQRAFVSGFAAPAFAAELAGITESGIAVRLHRGQSARGRRIAVGTRGGMAYAFAGHNAIAEELACFADDCDPIALAALENATYASVIDLCWGRGAKLWTLLSEIAARVEPGASGCDASARSQLPARARTLVHEERTDAGGTSQSSPTS